VTTIATNQGEPSYIKVDTTHVYWTATTDGAIRKSPKPPAPANVTTVASGLQSPFAMAHADADLFFASKGSGAGIWRVAKTGGAPVKLAEGLANVVAFEVDSTHVYWIDSGGLKRVPR
jgi:hypothetical protein